MSRGMSEESPQSFGFPSKYPRSLPSHPRIIHIYYIILYYIYIILYYIIYYIIYYILYYIILYYIIYSLLKCRHKCTQSDRTCIFTGKKQRFVPKSTSADLGASYSGTGPGKRSKGSRASKTQPIDAELILDALASAASAFEP